jgi:choline dehydrogenase-like flavoprotein
MIRRGRDLAADLALEVDAIVVGTGAGGSVAARALARAGARVVAFEEGGDHVARDMTQREDEMLPELFQDRAGRMTDDLAITVLQGRGVGGSTIHNTNLCKRIAPEILDLWQRKHGVIGCSEAEMRAAFETIERDLSVAPIPDDAISPNNDALRRGVAALGWRGGKLSHNRTGCQKSGFCELGCAYDAKNNARKIVIPQAVDAGCEVWADARVERVLHEGGRVTGVRARTASGRAIEARARVVVLSASAVGSAALALASDLPDPHGQHGRRLRIHPGAAVAGLFGDDDEQPIRGWKGIPQSWECTELLDLREGSDKRVWIVPAFAHPIGTAVTIPGFGAAHMRAMRSYGRLACLTAMVHDETEGHVYLARDGRPALKYPMLESDCAQLALGLRGAARLLLAAGAREVTVPGIPPLRVTRESELAAIDASFARPHGVPLTAVHPMGTMRLGEDPRVTVVKSTGEHHHVKGLFVLDGGLFPTSLGGPPQIPIYATAEHLSRHVVAAARHG